MGQTLPLFVYFRSFRIPYLTLNDISINGVIGIRTWDGMMVCTDESTDLWRHPMGVIV